MIYVWLENIKAMNIYSSYEEYWNSEDYISHVITGFLSYCPVMVEDWTPLWKE